MNKTASQASGCAPSAEACASAAAICAFTDKGRKLKNTITGLLTETMWTERPDGQALSDWAADAFAKRKPLVFIGATGIAVRTIAPFVRDKLADSPVIVIDELGRFAIPILSGHVGGANELAETIAAAISATPVITTATDIEDIWSVDTFAVKNGFEIENRKGIQTVSSALLAGKKIRIWVDEGIDLQSDKLPENVLLLNDKSLESDLSRDDRFHEGSMPPDNKDSKNTLPSDLTLIAKELVVGMGCRKGKTFEELKAFLEKHIADTTSICAIATIDIKKDELGLRELAQYYRVPLLCFPAEELRALPGDFSESQFVSEVTGVSNVCERAAAAGAGEGYRLVLHKTAGDGCTIAAALRRPKIISWES